MKDFPGLDPTLISAASIARRLQDPLGEYVKIDPKHLGVGMYQHDVQEAKLKRNLDQIMVECVSFVGVDLNFAPMHVLQKVAGLNAQSAKGIVEWREKNKAFKCRSELTKVKGLGPVTYQQCAGFVRIFSSRCVKLRLTLQFVVTSCVLFLQAIPRQPPHSSRNVLVCGKDP